MKNGKTALLGTFGLVFFLPHIAYLAGLDIKGKLIVAQPALISFTIFPPSEYGFTLKFDSRRQGQCSVQVLWPTGGKKKLFPVGEEFVAMGVMAPAKLLGQNTGPVNKQYGDRSIVSLWEGARIDFVHSAGIASIVSVKFPEKSIKAFEAADIRQIAVLAECRYSEGGGTEASDTQINLSDIKPKRGDTADAPASTIHGDTF